jgi:hypothetical protein
MEKQLDITKAKKKSVKKPEVEMVSYSIKMVIPTGQYANIQPEIIVRGGTIEEAHKFVAPHFNKLWKEYYLINERRPEPTPEVKTVVATPSPVTPSVPQPVSPTPVTPEVAQPAPNPVVTVQPPESSVAFVKAKQAIESCLSVEAFEIICNQVDASVKLTEEDKIALAPILQEKYEKSGWKII